MTYQPTRPTMFYVSETLLALEKQNFVHLDRHDIGQVRKKTRDLIKQGEVQVSEIVVRRLDETPLRLDLTGFRLEKLIMLKPHELIGHTEQTFYACFSWLGRRDPTRAKLVWFPSKSTRDDYLKAYEGYAWAVKKSELPAWKLRESIKGGA